MDPFTDLINLLRPQATLWGRIIGEPEDSEAIVAATGSTELVLGEATGSCAMLRCGRFVFSTTNEALLWSFLPSLVHIAAHQEISWRLRSLLSMNDAEGQHPGPGSDLVVSRLMELTLLELLRSELVRLKPGTKGLLSGLADPVLAKSPSAMHREVARLWTVAELARCNPSRFSPSRTIGFLKLSRRGMDASVRRRRMSI